jgi:hypothetical protein
MAWINPLDKIPQLPVDCANHIFYGGVTGLICLFIGFSPLNALLIAFAESAIKKTVDYFKEAESLRMCITKAFVTVFFPFAFYVYTLIK